MVNHIVHLEDDHHLFNIFRAAFQVVQPGLKLVQFTNPEALLNYVLQSPVPVDVAILDIRVPGSTSGIDLAQQIRKVQYPIHILITSAYTEPDRKLLVELNAQFIAKPWNINALVTQVLNLAPPKRQPEANPREGTATADSKKQRAEASSQAALPSYSLVHPSVSEEVSRHLSTLLELLKTGLQVQASALILSLPPTTTSDDKTPGITIIAHPPTWNMGKSRLMMISFAGQIMQQQTALLVDDLRPYLTTDHTGLSVTSFAGIPVNTEQVSGVVCVMDDKVRTWREHEQQLMTKTAVLICERLSLESEVQRLLQRNQSLYAYSSTIAHDLKAPLGAIIGYSDVVKLLMGSTVSEQVQHYLTNITDSASAMSDMITRLLWVAKLDHPQSAVTAVDTTAAVNAALTRLQYHIDRRGMRVTTSETFPSVLGHEAWIEEVFANLISNAVKYIGADNPDPMLEINFTVTDRRVKFNIRDNGIGISKEDQGRLFESFSRLNKVNAEGLGLGLVIVRRIITLLNGEFGLTSEEGQGSTFWFALPAAPTPDA